MELHIKKISDNIEFIPFTIENTISETEIVEEDLNMNSIDLEKEKTKNYNFIESILPNFIPEPCRRSFFLDFQILD